MHRGGGRGKVKEKSENKKAAATAANMITTYRVFCKTARD